MVHSTPDPVLRNEHSRRAILAAAIALSGELGYEGLSIEAIARQAGVGKQTIYRWWPSKGAVILEALIERVEDAVEFPFPDSGDVIEDMRAQLLASTQVLGSVEVGPAWRAVIAAAQSDPTLSRAHLTQLVEPPRVACHQLLVRAQDRGEIRADIDTQALIDMLWGAIFIRLLLHAHPLDPAQVDATLDIVLRGVR